MFSIQLNLLTGGNKQRFPFFFFSGGKLNGRDLILSCFQCNKKSLESKMNYISEKTTFSTLQCTSFLAFAAQDVTCGNYSHANVQGC
jgi:hypothetical protein